MFKKTLLRLTLVNACIITALFLVLIVGAIFHFQSMIIGSFDMPMRSSAGKLNRGIVPQEFKAPSSPYDLGITEELLPPTEPPAYTNRRDAWSFDAPISMVFNHFLLKEKTRPRHPFLMYIKANDAGVINDFSQQQRFGLRGMTELIQAINEDIDHNGIVLFRDVYYRYHFTPREDAEGKLYIIRDIDKEIDMFYAGVESLIVVGAICMFLSLFGSYMMAKYSIRPIEEIFSAQRDFLADASHELKTPLAIMRSTMDVIRSNGDETVAEQTHWLDNMSGSIDSMSKLVWSLLFLARADSAQIEFESELFSLDEVANSELRIIRPKMLEKRLRVATSIQSGVDIVGDEDKIRQVIRILLDNAIKFTNNGGMIDLKVMSYGGKAGILISDTGIGMTEDNLAKIFNRFHQADKSRHEKGFGLGLSIAKYIVDHHHGTIEAQSRLGAGTKFLVRLPLPEQ